jgi:small conductance mechanosensitive channel
VLGVYEAKGGDAAEHRKYVDSVRGGTLLEDFDFKKPSAVYTKLKAWVTSPEGGIKWATNIALFIVVMIVFRILAGVLGGITRRATGKLKRTSELLKDFFVNTVRKITFFIGLVIAISFLGVNIGPFLAAIGALGFIIGFALQGTLSNFASGIMILLYRPYDIGDFVDVAGVVGKVDAMSLVSTTIKTPDNQLVIVPNNSIWGGVITNVTGSPTRRVDMVFGIGYGDDIAKAKGILEDILKGHDKILDTPAYVVNVHELADSSVNFVVRPWVKTSDYWDVYWDVTRAVKERFDAEGVSIPFPQRDVHMHQVAAAE